MLRGSGDRDRERLRRAGASRRGDGDRDIDVRLRETLSAAAVSSPGPGVGSRTADSTAAMLALVEGGEWFVQDAKVERKAIRVEWYEVVSCGKSGVIRASQALSSSPYYLPGLLQHACGVLHVPLEKGNIERWERYMYTSISSTSSIASPADSLSTPTAPLRALAFAHTKSFRRS